MYYGGIGARYSHALRRVNCFSPRALLTLVQRKTSSYKTMHSKKSTSLCLLLILLMGSVEGTHAQTIKPAPVNLAFEKQLPEWLKETNVPATGIAIIENGKL